MHICTDGGRLIDILARGRLRGRSDDTAAMVEEKSRGGRGEVEMQTAEPRIV